MPTSAFEEIPMVISALADIGPRSLLDVGIGFGKYGLLAREYLDLPGEYPEQARGDSGRPGDAARRIRVDGVEVFPAYVTELQRRIYDHIHLGDICEIVGELPAYDMALIVDVLEHIPLERGRPMLEALLGKVRLGILVLTPWEPCPQGAAFGNEHERHVSRWRADDLDVGSGDLQWMRTGKKLLAYLRRPGAPAVSWLHRPRFRRRMHLALRRVACALVPDVVACPQV